MFDPGISPYDPLAVTTAEQGTRQSIEFAIRHERDDMKSDPAGNAGTRRALTAAADGRAPDALARGVKAALGSLSLEAER